MRFPPPTSVTTTVLALLALTAATGTAWESDRVRYDPQGRLTYPAEAAGHRIPDFSHAGYRGGGVPLPEVPVRVTLAPADGDDTARIQAALDEVAALPVQPNGYRGAVQLTAGVFDVAGTLRLRADGVVIGGAGDDRAAARTILRRTGTSQTELIIAGGGADDSFKSEVAGTRRLIQDARVPVGARSFTVDDATPYAVGDALVIWHPSTAAWIAAMNQGGVTDADVWQPGAIDIRYHRYVTAIAGNLLTVDAPVFAHLDRALAQSVVYRHEGSGLRRRLGIQDLEIDIVTAGPTSEDHAEDAVQFIAAEDSWIRRCTIRHFWHAGVQFAGSTRCTAEDVRALEPHSIITGSRRYNFSTSHAQLILFRDCVASDARHGFVANGTSADSGNVVLHGGLDRNITFSEGHRRWSTGLLFDGIVATNRSGGDVLGFYNRGNFGTGHGWGAGHSVIWNGDAAGGRILVQQPPTAQNYAIGSFGNVTGSGPFAGPPGFIEGANTSGLEPASLYLAQLDQRLRPAVAVATTAPGGLLTLAAVAPDEVRAYQWQREGRDLPGATTARLALPGLQPADAGLYSVATQTDAGPGAGRVFLVAPALPAGVRTAGDVASAGADIVHPNGNRYDQFLLTGPAATFASVPGKVTRVSYVDLNGDIVQVEFSGPGSLTLVLENPSGPAPAAKYHQPGVAYMQGHARLYFVGATSASHLNLFAVGRLTAFDPTGAWNLALPASATNDPLRNGNPIFPPGGEFDGRVDLAAVALASSTGNFGGFRGGDVAFFADAGRTGLFAPGVAFAGPVVVHELTAFGTATPVLETGAVAGGDVFIAGGALEQPNGRALQIGALARLVPRDGTDAHARLLPAQPVRARVERAGVDVTNATVVSPGSPTP